MKLTKKDINSLVRTGRISGMPIGTYVAGFDDGAGGYYPIYALGDFLVDGRDYELYTYLTHAPGGVEFYLRFI